jgi:hypothetical protein
MVSQTSQKLHRFAVGLFRDNAKAHDPYAWLSALQKMPEVPDWFPEWSTLQEDAIELVKGIAALKAQETLAATLTSSIHAYMHPNEKKSVGKEARSDNPLASMATSLLSNMMAPASGDGEKTHGADNPLVDMASSLLSNMMKPQSGTSRDSSRAEPLESPLNHLMDQWMYPDAPERKRRFDHASSKEEPA